MKEIDKKPHAPLSSRRAFMVGGAVLPVMALLGRGATARAGVEDAEALGALGDWGPLRAIEQRRQRTLQAHLDAENARDLDALMATFDTNAELVFNGTVASGAIEIERAFSSLFMALEGYAVLASQPQATANGLLVEGALIGRHIRELSGFPATNRQLQIPYSAFYGFSRYGNAIQTKRVVANYGVLGWYPLG